MAPSSVEWGSRGRGAGQFRVPHGVAVDGAGDVYVADRENGRVQVFDAKARTRPSGCRRSRRRRLPQTGAGDGARRGRAGAPGSCHVSSVDYDATLDALVTTEGDGVVVRTKPGCKVASHRGDWPHDAVLRVLAERGVGRPARRGAPEALRLGAELDGKRVTALAGKAGGAPRRTTYRITSPRRRRALWAANFPLRVCSARRPAARRAGRRGRRHARRRPPRAPPAASIAGW